MKIIYNNIIPVKGFVAMMLFGVIFARKKYKSLTWMVVNHEDIHKAQSKEARRYALWSEYLQNRPYKNWKQFKR